MMKNSKQPVNEIIYERFLSALPESKLKDNYLEILRTTQTTLSNEEIDLINSVDESDNPILMIAKLKKF